MRTKKPIGERKTRPGMKCLHVPERMWQQIEQIRQWLDRDLTTASMMLDCMDVGINWYKKKMEKTKKAEAAKPQPVESVPSHPRQNNTTQEVISDEEFDEMVNSLYQDK